MKRSTIARLLLGLAFALLSAGATFAAEVIHSFELTVRVAKDGELAVVETIRVRVEGYQIRHGIFRDFPLTFKDAGGTLREVTFAVLNISRDGMPERYHTERRHGAIRIYIGDKDTIVPRGDHIYTLRYRSGRQIRWFDGKAELNWNVTGNFWNFPIDAVSYSLQLADGARPTRWTAYTGRLGVFGTDWRGSIGSDGMLTVETTRRLAPGEGLTVVAAIPDGAVEPPTKNMLLWYEFLDSRRWILAGLGFVLVLGYYFFAWRAVGRDPRPGVIIPLFHPPTGISPALANYIHDWGLSRHKWRAFTAAILSLAVRGLVRVDQQGERLTLTSTGKQPTGGPLQLPPGERAVFSYVNVGGKTVIDKDHATTVAALDKSFTTSIESENKNRFFRRNLGYVLAGLAMTAVVVLAVVTFGGLRDEDFTILFATAFGGFFIGIFLLPVLQAVLGGANFKNLASLAIHLAVFAVFVAVAFNIADAINPAFIARAIPKALDFVQAYPFPFLLVTAFAGLNGLFLYLMRAPTALGRPVMDQLAGFRLYLETAESDRLNMQAPEITPERFEAILPYAVALDVEKPWSAAFASALRRAHPEDADPMRHYRPGWYSGSSWSGGDFSHSVASTVSSMSSAFASAEPVSSGSSGFGGGGGGSGGGGGGGGGGGW